MYCIYSGLEFQRQIRGTKPKPEWTMCTGRRKAVHYPTAETHHCNCRHLETHAKLGRHACSSRAVGVGKLAQPCLIFDDLKLHKLRCLRTWTSTAYHAMLLLPLEGDATNKEEVESKSYLFFSDFNSLTTVPAQFWTLQESTWFHYQLAIWFAVVCQFCQFVVPLFLSSRSCCSSFLVALFLVPLLEEDSGQETHSERANSGVHLFFRCFLISSPLLSIPHLNNYLSLHSGP